MHTPGGGLDGIQKWREKQPVTSRAVVTNAIDYIVQFYLAFEWIQQLNDNKKTWQSMTEAPKERNETETP